MSHGGREENGGAGGSRAGGHAAASGDPGSSSVPAGNGGERPAPVLSKLALVATPFVLLAVFFLLEWWLGG